MGEFITFGESFIYMGIGMAGIFIIIGMLVLMLKLFERFFPAKGDE
jgi:hypothetical protein